MFDTLMKPGSFRVDYFKDRPAGTTEALGLYACGEIAPQAGYSLSARRNLLAGLMVIQRNFGISNLVAVYLDVHSARQPSRPAFEQLKRDLRAGLFKRAFVYSACTLQDRQEMLEDLGRLAVEISGFELIPYQDGLSKARLLA